MVIFTSTQTDSMHVKFYSPISSNGSIIWKQRDDRGEEVHDFSRWHYTLISTAQIAHNILKNFQYFSNSKELPSSFFSYNIYKAMMFLLCRIAI